jgi:hypothetical protein
MQAGWRVYCPVVVLLAVAAAQLVLVRAAGLTPWKGGGFGMFAAVDGGAVRSVRIVVEGPDRSEVLDVPPSLELDADRAAALPIAGLLARLADAVAARAVRRGEHLSRVIVEVWTARLSPDGSQAEAERLARYVYSIDGRDP